MRRLLKRPICWKMFKTTLDVKTVWNGNALSVIVVGSMRSTIYGTSSFCSWQTIWLNAFYYIGSSAGAEKEQNRNEWMNLKKVDRGREMEGENVCYSFELPQGAVVPLFSLISLSSTCWTVAKFSVLSTIIAVECWSYQSTWADDKNPKMESKKSTVYCVELQIWNGKLLLSM